MQAVCSQVGVVPVSIDDNAAEVRAQGWRTLAALHARIEDALERALQREHGLSEPRHQVAQAMAHDVNGLGLDNSLAQPPRQKIDWR